MNSSRLVLPPGNTVWLLIALVGFVGCGESHDVGKVTGTVTLDSEPLSGATVTFKPVTPGAPSIGQTNGEGVYELQYTRDVAGAEIGEHTVTISTKRQGDPDAEPPIAKRPEQVPAKYNKRTELKATVSGGQNRLDFPLKSDGPVSDSDDAESTSAPEGTC